MSLKSISNIKFNLPQIMAFHLIVHNYIIFINNKFIIKVALQTILIGLLFPPNSILTLK